MGRLGPMIVSTGLCVVLLAPLPAIAQAPVKIGMLVPLTGIFTRNGREALDGARLYFDEIRWNVQGRPIELLVEDSEGKQVFLEFADEERAHYELLIREYRALRARQSGPARRRRNRAVRRVVRRRR